MDAKSIGATIATLRKKRGMTQLELAQKLNVSSKAVSKWENGQGYPDITLFPLLAALFGVSLDFLMLQKKGIVVAGNMLVDIVKQIDHYPEQGTLATVLSVSQAVGGCAPNTAIDLAKIDPSLPVGVCGSVGMDDNGRYLLSELQKNGINVDRIRSHPQIATSFSDVMSVASGERTFFHQKGANAVFSPSDIVISELNCDIFHIGYILLLDLFDAEDAEFGTAMARFLSKVQQADIKTSIDVVSDSSADYKKKIVPALRYCNYVIINELEACSIFGLSPRHENGTLHRENIRTAMQEIIRCGVRDKVIIHSRETCFVADAASGAITEVASLKIPKEEILGNVGAGDAFCAGALYALYHGYPDRQLLEFASSAAACNLFAANSVDGMRSKEEILKMEQKYGRLTQ